MKSRIYKYPDDLTYTSTTYYDEEKEYLDLGFQRLKKIINYPEFSYLKKLFIDHNNLSILPDPSLLPHLSHLTCSFNKLSIIPFYPRLSLLNISNNNISYCFDYNNSNLKYFDCSFNPFIFNIKLEKCIYLFINNCSINKIDLDLIPNIKYLDVSNNNLTELKNSNLLELDIQNNHFSSLNNYPNLKYLIANNNNISNIKSYPNLLSLEISFNNLIFIPNQNKLKKLIATNNKIEKIGELNEIELIDLSYNNLKNITLKNPKYISIQFNPINNILLSEQTLINLKELQINYKTYCNIYNIYYDYFEYVSIQVNQEKLKSILNKLENKFDNHVLKYLLISFSKIDFKKKDKQINKMSKYVSKKMNEKKEIFQKIFLKIYYKCIVVILYFKI